MHLILHLFNELYKLNKRTLNKNHLDLVQRENNCRYHYLVTTPLVIVIGMKDLYTRENSSLDEVITLPKYDLDNMTLDKMQNLQASLSHKTKKELLR